MYEEIWGRGTKQEEWIKSEAAPPRAAWHSKETYQLLNGTGNIMAAALRNKKGPNGMWTRPRITRPMEAGVMFLWSAWCSIMKGSMRYSLQGCWPWAQGSADWGMRGPVSTSSVQSSVLPVHHSATETGVAQSFWLWFRLTVNKNEQFVTSIQ
jgi:hypothetical protein